MRNGDNVRALCFEAKLAAVKANLDYERTYEMRKTSWLALEKALTDGKVKHIGVSNYPAELLLEMKEYATVMPAVNQLELHPRHAAVELQKVAKEMGVVLTAYGTGNSVLIEKNPVVSFTPTSCGSRLRFVFWHVRFVALYALCCQSVCSKIKFRPFNFYQDATTMYSCFGYSLISLFLYAVAM